MVNTGGRKMKVHELISKCLYDQLRFYEDNYNYYHNYCEIDEYTPYKTVNEVDLNREVKYLFPIIEGSNGEYENDWISIILKEEQNAQV